MIQIIKPVLKVSFSTGCEIKGHLEKNYKIIYVITVATITAKSTKNVKIHQAVMAHKVSFK